MVAALVGLVGAATLRIRDRSVPPPRGVVLVLIDTLRADHLRLYGYARPTSPFLDALAARSVVFEHAVSAASTTFPAVNSLFTSRHPDVFFDTTASNLGIPRDITTLAEVFQAHGFRTGAVSASSVVRRSPSRFNPEGGFGRGFEVFDESLRPPGIALPQRIAASGSSRRV